MRHKMGFALALGVLCATAVWAQEGPPPSGRPAGPPDEEFLKMERHSRGLEIQAREAKLQFEQEMNNLQLEQRRLELEQMKRRAGFSHGGPRAGEWRGHGCRGAGALLLLCLVVHVLLAVWVNQDVRRRNAGSGLWVAVTLLTGLFGAAVYALVRLGDKPAQTVAP